MTKTDAEIAAEAEAKAAREAERNAARAGRKAEHRTKVEMRDIRRGSGRRIAQALHRINHVLKDVRSDLDRFIQVKIGDEDFKPHPMIAEFYDDAAEFDRLLTQILHPPVPDEPVDVEGEDGPE